ncbi:hypothetical protein MBLNU230_g2930t1 [Neophaeotheca triangularis]
MAPTTAAEAPVAKILELPPELLVSVASHLSTARLGCFRLTCQTIEKAVFDSFAREFFTKRQFAIEEVSLQALVDISKHAVLSKRLSEVIISLEKFNNAAVHLDINDTNTVVRRMYSQALIDSGRASDMLVEAFSNLPNLRTIGLRDYNARGRFRDGETALWKSYGWTSIYPTLSSPRQSSPTPQQQAQQNDIDTRVLSYNRLPPSTALPLIMFALGKANVRLDNIEVFLRNCHLIPESLEVLQSGFMAEIVKPVISGLKTLMLTLGLIMDTGHGAPHLPSSESDPIDAPLKQLLHQTSNLETLRINFVQVQFFCNPVLHWLGKKSVSKNRTDRLLHPPPLSNLATLEIGMAQVVMPTLLDLLVKFGPKLKALSLWKLTLLRNYSPQPHDTSSLWASLLPTFAVTLPDNAPLQSIMIGFIGEEEPTERLDCDPVYFKASARENIEDITQLSIRTSKFKASETHTSAKEWLKDLGERVVDPVMLRELDGDDSGLSGLEDGMDGLDEDGFSNEFGESDEDSYDSELDEYPEYDMFGFPIDDDLANGESSES